MLIATIVFVGIYIVLIADDQPLSKILINSSIFSVIGGVVFFLLSKSEKEKKFVESLIITLTPILVYCLLAVIGIVRTIVYLLKCVIKVLFFDQGYHG